MRFHPAYDRVFTIITAPDVPRTPSGAIAICHFCQRHTEWAGSFTALLADDLAFMGKQAIIQAGMRRTSRRRYSPRTSEPSSIWQSSKNVRKLRNRWLTGFTAKQIARELKTTRAAVLGKLNRLGLLKTRPRS